MHRDSISVLTWERKELGISHIYFNTQFIMKTKLFNQYKSDMQVFQIRLNLQQIMWQFKYFLTMDTMSLLNIKLREALSVTNGTTRLLNSKLCKLVEWYFQFYIL